LWVVLLLGLCLTPLQFLSACFDPFHAARLVMIGLIALSLEVLLLWLTYVGSTQLASWLCLSLFWLLATWSIITSGGMQAVALMSYLVFIVLAGQLFGVRAGLVMVGLNIAVVVPIQVADSYGQLPPAIHHTRASLLVQTIFQFACVISLQAVAAVSVRDALAKAHGEIAERKAAEASLRESEERLRVVTSTIPGVVYLFRMKPDGWMGLTYVSKQCEAILGIPAEPAGLLERFTDMVLPEYRKAFVESITQSVSQGREWRCEGKLRKPSGEIICFLAHSSAVWMEEDDVVYSGVVTDVTSQREVEEERARLAAILECTSDLVGMTTPDGRLSYLNKAGRQMFGWGEFGDVSGYTIADCHPGWAYKILMDEALPLVREVGLWRGETAVVDGDGREIPVSQTLMAHRSLTGELEYYSTIMRDISERKRAEEELRFANAILRTQQETSADGILVVDGHGRVVSSNRRFCDMWGVPADLLATGSDEVIRESVLGRIADPEAFLSRIECLYKRHDESSWDEIALTDGATLRTLLGSYAWSGGHVLRPGLVLQGYHRSQASRRSPAAS